MSLLYEIYSAVAPYTRIRKTLRESRHGWTTRQANDLIVNESGIIHYHYTHVYRLLHRWGFKQKVPRKVGTCKHCLKWRKRGIQKRAKVVLDNLPKGFTAISLDESFFFFDSLVRKVWIFKNTRPVVRITGSHQQSCLFGAVSIDGRQLFRQYNHFNENTFYIFLK